MKNIQFSFNSSFVKLAGIQNKYKESYSIYNNKANYKSKLLPQAPYN